MGRESGGAKAACVFGLTLSKIDAARQDGEEIPLSVLFSALVVGNFPVAALGDEFSEDATKDILSFWELNPFAEEIPAASHSGVAPR